MSMSCCSATIKPMESPRNHNCFSFILGKFLACNCITSFFGHCIQTFIAYISHFEYLTHPMWQWGSRCVYIPLTLLMCKWVLLVSLSCGLLPLTLIFVWNQVSNQISFLCTLVYPIFKVSFDSNTLKTIFTLDISLLIASNHIVLSFALSYSIAFCTVLGNLILNLYLDFDNLLLNAFINLFFFSSYVGLTNFMLVYL